MGEREYWLIVDGELSDSLRGAFAGMTVTPDGGKTILAGRVRDQAELQGLIQRVSDLGLTLVGASSSPLPPTAAPRE